MNKLTSDQIEWLRQLQRGIVVRASDHDNILKIGRSIDPTFSFCRQCPGAINPSVARLYAVAEKQIGGRLSDYRGEMTIETNYPEKFFDNTPTNKIKGLVVLTCGKVMGIDTDDRKQMIKEALKLLNEK